MPGKENKKNTATAAPKPQKKTANMLFVLILAAISITVYANTFKNGFVLDDFSVYTKNTIVTKGILAIPEILSTPYRRGFYVISNDLYRPLSLVMFAIENQLFNGDPYASHVINVFLFAACVVLLFLFLDALSEKKNTIVAFIAALLFAVHPIHTEVVANIKSRDELLCFFFAFISLNVFIKYIDSGKIKQLAIAGFCYFLSLLSKETAISFLAIIPIVFFFYRNENKKRSIYIIASVIITAVAFLAIRFFVLNAYHANKVFEMTFMDNALSKPPSVASGLATAIYIMGEYIKLLIVPYPLICDYSYNSIPFVTFSNIWVLLSCLMYISLAVVGTYLLMKFKKNLFAFGISFFLITIALFSNIVFPLGAEMGERFLFFSSAGYCWILGLLVGKWVIQSPGIMTTVLYDRKFLVVCFPVLLIYSFITVSRNFDWYDGLTLYKADVEKSPNDAKLNYYLGSELMISAESADMADKAQRFQDAIPYLQKAIIIYPDYMDAHKRIGDAFFIISHLDSAEFHYQKAIAINPKDIEPINHLDIIYFKTQRYKQSLELCKRAVLIDTNYTEGYSNMGMCYLYLKKYDSAIYCLNKAISVDRDYNPSYEFLAMVYKEMNYRDSAIKYEAIAKVHDPAFHIY